MAEKKKSGLTKRIVMICLVLVAIFGAVIGIRQIYVSNFVYCDPVFTGYGFHTNETVQRITADDMQKVTDLLNSNHISYRINDTTTYIFVQSYKWADAVDILKNSGLDFDGCIIS